MFLQTYQISGQHLLTLNRLYEIIKTVLNYGAAYILPLGIIHLYKGTTKRANILIESTTNIHELKLQV